MKGTLLRLSELIWPKPNGGQVLNCSEWHSNAYTLYDQYPRDCRCGRWSECLSMNTNPTVPRNFSLKWAEKTPCSLLYTSLFVLWPFSMQAWAPLHTHTHTHTHWYVHTNCPRTTPDNISESILLGYPTSNRKCKNAHHCLKMLHLFPQPTCMSLSLISNENKFSLVLYTVWSSLHLRPALFVSDLCTATLLKLISVFIETHHFSLKIHIKRPL